MRPGKTTHIFEIGDYSAKFSGNFDSGNLRNVLQITPFHYQLESAFDSYEFPSTSKVFFHFYLEGFPQGATLKLVFKRLALLTCIKDDAYKYRPFHSFDGQNYSRLTEKEVQVIDSFQGQNLILNVKSVYSRVYYSFALPYSYQKYLNMVRDLPSSNQSMYIHKEVLCYSNNLNLVYVISITSPNKGTQQDEKIGESSNTILLPEKHLNPPKKYFQKPVILISSRVHPGQTASSWAAQGILKYLTSDNQQAQLIRKHFQVVVVPMLNPDGVQEGLYRLDPRGYNLNRYYLVSDNRQPSIYCMKHLIRHYSQTKRLLYYFDLHGHPSQKGSFLYGNALDQLPFQVQTQMFARFMSLNCQTFEQKFCIFDREQMSSKDRYDQYTKEGCARVFAFKAANILHSYTIQHGLHGLSDKQSNFLFSGEAYYQQGIAILTSVLMTCRLKQPPQPTNLRTLRKQLVLEICARDDRFKKEERFLSQKKQKVNEIVEKDYWQPIMEQHFTQSHKIRHNTSPRKKFKVHKKQTINSQIQSFYSEQLKQKDKPSEKEEKSSFADMYEYSKSKFDKTHPSFKLYKNNPSVKFSSTTKTDLDSPLERVMPKLGKLVTRTSVRPPLSQNTFYRQKFRSLKKNGILNPESRASGREEQNLFGDTNIRTQSFAQPTVSRNKIHSLFIEAHD